VLQGLPDLTGPTRGVLPPYEAGSWVALPTALQIAQPHGVPDLRLAKFRPERADETPPPGGTIDFRLELTYELDAALTAARQTQADATVAPAGATAGYLRLALAAPGSTQAPDMAELVAPVPVAWDGLDSGRFTLACSPEAATFFETALAGGTVALQSHAELEYGGVAARVPLQIGSDRAALIAEIDGRVGHERIVSRAALLDLLTKPPASVTIVAGEWGDGSDVAAALADWIRARLASLAPAPTAGADTYLELQEAGHGSVAWDLSQPIVTWRALALEFDPLADVRRYVTDNGTRALVTETDVPSIPTGLNMVSVRANLPAARPGLLEIGVTVEAPPRPPLRMQTSRATVMLIPPEDAGSPVLHLSPAEKLEYNSIAYAVPEGADELQGPVVARSGPALGLQMDDFPVDFFVVRASAALLEACSAIGLSFQRPAGQPATTAQLDLLHTSVAFSQPAGEGGATITAELRPRDAAPAVVLGPVPAQPWSLDLTSCPAYGPKQVQIGVTFPPGTTDYAVELLPELAPESPDRITAFDFTPQRVQRTYSYVSSSPFHGGYRWREYRSQLPFAAWSLVAPDAPLALVAQPAVGAST